MLRGIIQKIKSALAVRSDGAQGTPESGGSPTRSLTSPDELLNSLIHQHRTLRGALDEARAKLKKFHADGADNPVNNMPEDRAARLHRGIVLEERVARLTADLLAFQRTTLVTVTELRSRLDATEAAARLRDLDDLSNSGPDTQGESPDPEFHGERIEIEGQLADLNDAIAKLRSTREFSNLRYRNEEAPGKGPKTFPLLPILDAGIPECARVKIRLCRPRSVVTALGAMTAGIPIILVRQRDATKEPTEPSDLEDSGMIGKILSTRDLADGEVEVLIETRCLVNITSFSLANGPFMARVAIDPESPAAET